VDDVAGLDPAGVTRVLMCSGQVYYDLAAAREERKIQNVAAVRLEQMYPFPASAVRVILGRYPATSEVVWVQEEPRNMGAWRFVEEQMQPILEDSQRAIRYVGRVASASPSTGSLKRHQQEQAELVDAAFAAEIRVVPKRRAAARRKR
jgi:2-oxoglutarate dehydrogenase E1 component